MFSKITRGTCQIFVQRMKNSDFILESKMVELNKNENSKQQDQPDAG